LFLDLNFVRDLVPGPARASTTCKIRQHHTNAFLWQRTANRPQDLQDTTASHKCISLTAHSKQTTGPATYDSITQMHFSDSAQQTDQRVSDLTAALLKIPVSLDVNARSAGKQIPTFWRIVLPLSSGLSSPSRNVDTAHGLLDPAGRHTKILQNAANYKDWIFSKIL
jgi:hypothetical protein